MTRAAIGALVLAAASGFAEEELPIPQGPEPAPVAIPHLPRRLDAFVFRNWGVVPPERIAAAIGAELARVRELARELGLGDAPAVGEDALRRSALTIIRRNWHLLPYSQLLALLGWTEGQLGYTLREDDFLWIKLGSLKPKCEPIRFEEPDAAARERHAEIRSVVEAALGAKGLAEFEPRFAFVAALSAEDRTSRRVPGGPEPGDQDLTSGWTIELPEGADEVARSAVERFRRALRAEFAADVGLAAPGTVAHKIQVRFARTYRNYNPPEERELKPESFLSGMDHENVTIQASDGSGLLRALDRLLDSMEQRGGPFVRYPSHHVEPTLDLRLIHSYFALYGDALLDRGLDPYPDGYLARLSRCGVNGVWLPVLLRNMAPAAETLGLVEGEKSAADRNTRLENLADLVARARRFGIGVYLYLNEPRAMPLEFFRAHESLRGVVEGPGASLCTSVPEVRQWIADSVAHIVKRAPDLGGFFTITASENLTSCWSHGRGRDCSRCASRKPWEVIAEVNTAVADGIHAGGSKARCIAWDWGWEDEWIEPAIAALPAGSSVMSVSEWGLPISRGGIETTVGEYSLSAIGVGDRALRTWRLAKARGLEAIAKAQVGCSWELSAVPYVPAIGALPNYGVQLSEAGVDGVMLGWTLGGYPSPNVEVIGQCALPDKYFRGWAIERPQSWILGTAARRFGEENAPAVANAWIQFSLGFQQYPFHVGVVYRSPIQLGPANLLHVEATGYASTMVGFPYDDLDGWRAVYPADIYADLLESVVLNWEGGLEALPSGGGAASALAAERRVATAALLHFRSTAAQARFVLARRAFEQATARKDRAAALVALDDLERISREEETSARRLLEIVRADSRIGFEASNQYYYMPVDLLEKVVSCRWIAEKWIPVRRTKP